MSKHQIEQAKHQSKALVDQNTASPDRQIEDGKHKDDGGALGWAEREAAECWKGTCKMASATAKNIGDACKVGKENFDQQPEWAKILEAGAVTAVAIGGAAKYSAAANAEANQAVQNGLKRQGTLEVTSWVKKTASGETHIDHEITYGDGSKANYILDANSAAGKKALQKGMTDWLHNQRH